MKRRIFPLFYVLAFMALYTGAAYAFAPPCAGSYVSTTKPIIVPSAAATVAISNHSSTAGVIYVCGWHLLSTGGTSLLSYGTGTTCGTGGVNLTGALAAADTVTQHSDGSELFKIPPGNDLCVTGGTSAAGTGWVTYVSPTNLNP